MALYDRIWIINSTYFLIYEFWYFKVRNIYILKKAYKSTLKFEMKRIIKYIQKIRGHLLMYPLGL